MKTLRLEMRIVVVLLGTTLAQVTQRVSVDSTGAQANNNSFAPAISADGRYIAFTSHADNLVPGDTGGKQDVFVRDRQTGVTERVSVDSNGNAGDEDSGYFDYSAPSISADGRYVAFVSSARNLVAGDTNGAWDVFVRDRQNGTTERVSIDSNGAQGDGDSGGQDSAAVLTPDGRYVAFGSSATNLVAGDTNGFLDVFVHDRQTGATERVSVDSFGVQGDDVSGIFPGPAISADGRFVAFGTFASNLVPGDTNVEADVLLHDRQTGSTERVSVSSQGVEGDGSSWNPSISADGNLVAFSSYADNLSPVDGLGNADIFARDRNAGTTTLVSATWQDHCLSPSVSADGRYIAFEALGNIWYEVFVHDRQTAVTEWVSVNLHGSFQDSDRDSDLPSISADGRFVAFESFCSSIVPGDTNSLGDAFVREREHQPSASLCEPGASGTLGCPCSNPPSGAGRGCDNSSATGGASLAVSGGEYLSSDSLVFTTSDESPNKLSIVVQGTHSVASGVIYGQGVRCVGGSLKRLYVRTASSGGGITVPDFLAGDPLVHSRSASIGDVIAAGSSRWYMVFYRDPIVLGGCSATSTFNSTQTREVAWKP